MKIMKQYITIILAMIVSSCSDDFLNLSPISTPNVETFYKTASDFDSAMNAAYANLAKPLQYGSDNVQFGGKFFAMMEVRADDAAGGNASAGSGLDTANIDNFIANPLGGVIEGAWLGIYKTIFDANAILTRIGDAKLDKTVETKYIAEARFLRGLCYFNAVRLWGDIPLVLEEITTVEAKNLSRNKVDDIYKTIEDDLKYAAANLAEKNDVRGTSGAAKALLGKVYLTRKEWAKAQAVLQEVVSSNTYSLEAKIADIFDLKKDESKEIMFSIYFSGSFSGNNVGHSGFGQPTMSQTLLGLYGSSDERKALIEDSNSDSTPDKYDLGGSPSGRNFPVIRYSDVLLMLAEAINEQGFSTTAVGYLNAVRSRAGAGNTTATSQADFRDAIATERRLEFPLEFSRWFDLVRTGKALSVMNAIGKKTQAYQLIYPIPQNEINVYNNKSKFPQNTGY